MKPFASWISDMANSIEDGSIVKHDVEVNSNVVKDVKCLSEIQKRVIIADLLVSEIENSGSAYDWITAFSVRLCIAPPGKRSLVQGLFSNIVGTDKSKVFYSLHEEKDIVSWVETFRKGVLNELR